MSRKKEAKARQITRQLIGIDEITDSGLQTSHGRLVFFAIKPTNLSVQPPDAVSSRMPRASAVSRTMVMPPGGSNFPQTKGTSMRNIPLLACFAVGRVWSRTMRGRWSYTQPPHSSTSPMLPTS